MISFYSVLISSAFVLLSSIDEEYTKKDRNAWMEAKPETTYLDYLPQINEYDFIVVGAGAAGSVVANKLSENFNVLLLEVGGDPIPVTNVPVNYINTMLHNATAHQWYSVPQTKSGLWKNGEIYIAQGRALGGSTTINGMSYNRGHAKDYANWAMLVEDEAWNYENLLKYFKLTENFYDYEQNNEHIGFEGPIYLSKHYEGLGEKWLNVFNIWVKSGQALGYESQDNPNGPQKEGFVPLTYIRKDGVRWTAYDGFLKPILDRESLTILRYSEVKKIELDENGKAIGVQYKRHGIEQYAKAKREIILSAGALNSPLILLRSGIGPKDDLEKAGIEVKLDLPVGQHYQDHPDIFLTSFDISPDFYKEYTPEEEIKKYIENGSGILGNLIDVFGQAFLVSEEAKKAGENDWPDIQYIAWINSSYMINGDDKVVISVNLGRPTSSGNVRIDPENPHENPVLWNPNYLDTDRDIKALIEGMRIADKVYDTPEFQSIGGKINKEPIPECAQHSYGTDEHYECHARQRTFTIWHPSGTCKMGKEGDPKMVVDTRLKVKGINGLRVIDNSIMPMVTNGNTMAVAYVIGQKGVDMVLEDNK